MKNQADNLDAFKDHLPSYLISIHPGGRAIYLISILLLCAMLASLPLISVHVSVSGRGIIRPLRERTNIVASTSGIVEEVYVEEGSRIKKSEPMLRIRSIESEKNLLTLKLELQETRTYLDNLGHLISCSLNIPLSNKYSGEYAEYLDRLDYLMLLQAKSEKELQRHEGLFKSGLISEKAYDDLIFEVEKSQKELDNYKSQSISHWQSEYQIQLGVLRDLQKRIINLEEQIRLTTIYAPETGSLVEFTGIFEGSVVQAGTIIAILSPESGLIGEFYIPSRDVAFLQTGQKVNLHLDAFTTREWGVLPGKIYEISNDFILLNNQPVYRVKCRLGKKVMNLKNGYTGTIKKGMTFQARCLVARRTLFQLLADKAENWLKPALPPEVFITLP